MFYINYDGAKCVSMHFIDDFEAVCIYAEKRETMSSLTTLFFLFKKSRAKNVYHKHNSSHAVMVTSCALTASACSKSGRFNRQLCGFIYIYIYIYNILIILIITYLQNPIRTSRKFQCKVQR